MTPDPLTLITETTTWAEHTGLPDIPLTPMRSHGALAVRVDGHENALLSFSDFQDQTDRPGRDDVDITATCTSADDTTPLTDNLAALRCAFDANYDEPYPWETSSLHGTPCPGSPGPQPTRRAARPTPSPTRRRAPERGRGNDHSGPRALA